MRRRAFLLAASAALVGVEMDARAQTPAATTASAPSAPVRPVTAVTPTAPPLPAPAPQPPVTPPPELEAIRASVIGRRGLTIRLASHGCTRKADIAWFIERKAGVTTLAFGRKRIEMCGRGRPGEISLDFSFKELGVDPDEPVVVLNPLLAAKAPAWTRGRR